MAIVNHIIAVKKIKKPTIVKVLSTWRLQNIIEPRWWFQRLLQVIEPYFSIKLQILLAHCWIFYLVIDVKASCGTNYQKMVQMFCQAPRGKLCRLWFLCTREFQSVTALPCLNGDTSICMHIDGSCTPALTDTECTVLQGIQKKLDCLLSAQIKLEASHVDSFSTILSPQNIAGGNWRFLTSAHLLLW